MTDNSTVPGPLLSKTNARKAPGQTRIDPAAACLVIIAFLLSACWAFSTPIPIDSFNSQWGNFHPDEGSHMSVIEYTATYHGLPPYRSPYDASIHPPLYHSFVAASADALTRPFLGRGGALRFVRLLSAAMGAGVVYFTFVAGRALGSRRLAILAAAFVLLLPMRASLAGGMSNENLAALGAAGACSALAWGLRKGFDTRRTLALAFWTAVGIGCKLTCLGLLPAAAVALIWGARRRRTSLRVAFLQWILVCGFSAACVGWWLVRNVVLYGDPVRSAAADRIWDAVQPGAAVIMVRKHWLAWRYLVSIYANGWLSFWGAFDGMSHRMPWAVYDILVGLQAVILAALARLGWRKRRLLVSLAPLLAAWGVFAGFVLLVFTQYNWKHYTPQGRYYFVLLVPFGTLMAIGWQVIFPNRESRRIGTVILISALAALNLWALYVMPRRIGRPEPTPPITYTPAPPSPDAKSAASKVVK